MMKSSVFFILAKKSDKLFSIIFYNIEIKNNNNNNKLFNYSENDYCRNSPKRSKDILICTV